MKLRENKEILPVSFLTSFVSDGWDKVGIIKEQINAISDQFSGTEKVTGVMQDLIDAYLICLGQLETFMDKKDYFETTEENDQIEAESEIDDSVENETVAEDLNVKTAPLVDVKLPIEANVSGSKLNFLNGVTESQANVNEDVNLDLGPVVKVDSGIRASVNDTEANFLNGQAIKEAADEKFEYFVDFEDPATGEEDSDYKVWMNRNNNI